MPKTIDGFEIKTMSKSQLAREYGIDPDTLMVWIARLHSDTATKLGEIKKVKLLTPVQVSILVEVWGAP